MWFSRCMYSSLVIAKCSRMRWPEIGIIYNRLFDRVARRVSTRDMVALPIQVPVTAGV